MHNIYEMDASDGKEAEELALGKLRDMSFNFLRAEGSGEGNAKLSAGTEVTVKYVGKAYSGDYIAESVTHDFSLDEGYVTRFKLKRNMMDDEFAKKTAGSGNSQNGNGRGGTAVAGRDTAVTDSQAGEAAEDEEEEDGPEFRGLKWKKDGKEVSEALVDDEVAMFFEVKNIGEGEKVNVTIYEHDDDGEHDHIKDVTGSVKDGKVEIPWKVEYHDDDDDSDSEQEIKEMGFSLPEYFFIAEYGGIESEESKLLNVGAYVYGRLYDDGTDKILANTEYILHLPDGSTKNGVSDDKGFIRVENLPYGETRISLKVEYNG